MVKKLKINTDGASKGNPGPMTIGVVFQTDKKIIRKISKKIGYGTNNQAEYTAVIYALDLARRLGYEEIELCSDSQLLVNQLNGDYAVKSKNILDLNEKVKKLKTKFKKINFKWVPREKNEIADDLANE